MFYEKKNGYISKTQPSTPFKIVSMYSKENNLPPPTKMINGP